MKKNLDSFLKMGKFVSIYCDNDFEKFFYGKLLAVSSSEIALLMISPEGDFDGFLVKKIVDIAKIEFDGQYEEKMKKLISFNTDTYSNGFKRSDLLEDVLSMANIENYIVSIELLNSQYENVVGFVEETGKECIIRQIDKYGFNDGFSCIRFQDITQIVCNSKTEAVLYKLWKMNY